MTNDDIIRKVRKLLALAANNPSEAEAAAAAAKAQALIDAHKLEAAMVAADEQEDETPELQTPDTKTVWRWEGRRVKNWQRSLCSAVCEAQGLYGFSSWDSLGRCYKAVGPIQDIELAKMMIGWLVGEVDQLQKRRKEELGVGLGKGFWNSWRHGCVNTISKRLMEESRKRRQKALEGPNADDYAAAAGDPEAMLALDRQQSYGLVRVERGLAILKQQATLNRETAKKENDLKTVSYGTGSSFAGRTDGALQGRKARLNPGKGLKG